MNRTAKIIIALVIGACIVVVGWLQIKKWHQQQLEAAVGQSQAECQQMIDKLQAQLAEMQDQLQSMGALQIGEEELQGVFGSPQAQHPTTGDVDCGSVEEQLNAFFDYLDGKGYLAEHEFETNAGELFQDSMSKLAQKKPLITGEMEDLFRLMGNVAHLYRALGLKRIKLARHIMEEEIELMEPAMAVLFGWLTVCGEDRNNPESYRNLQNLYAYAGFFLDTLGGQSYLMRRNSTIRLLTSFYSLQILDLANDNKLNSAGIDIRKFIGSLYYNISRHRGLRYREHYLSTLAALQGKYQ